jgi:rubrerythrin
MDPDTFDMTDALLDTQSSLDIIRLLEQNEIKIGQLYERFAQKYPEHAAFWHKIAGDENEHANWVSNLYSEVSDKRLRFKKDRFNKQTLQSFNEYISNKISGFDNTPFLINDAFALSLELEKNLIERSFFEVFDSDSDILKTTFDKLRSSTELHYQNIKAIFDKLTSKS